ncbi:hypothetical protein BDA99DRAFT_571617 [Phascolomyces articulosus]|uniref:VASt domain-containing protein n=1 Tax=Phascolomyces articulosus TaxID=60185 RepID=A0AAD5KAW8_9FUNG|nr:hypothetical protein BDA99DRAFT_571617 [Phascolomyces articulosus]
MVFMGPSPTSTSNSTPLLSRSTNNTLPPNPRHHDIVGGSTKHLPLPSPATSSQSRRSSMSTTTATSIDVTQTPPLKTKRSDEIKLASTKRNIEFHTLFRSVPESDHLMDDYGCALQKEILIQGRIYISGSHICFNANIFGWVTNLVIDFTDIIEIEKRSTAIFIPNAIQISTSQAKYFFASFLSRDQAYDHITQLWRESQQRQTLSPSSDVTKVGSYDDQSSSNLTEDDDSMSSLSYDTESSMDDRDTLFPPPEFCSSPSTTPPTSTSTVHGNPYERQNSLATLPSTTKHPHLDRRRTASESQLSAKKDNDAKQQPTIQRQHNNTNGHTNNNDVVEETTSSATGCNCHNQGGHYTHTVMDQVYHGSIEKVYNLLANRSFLQKFLTEIEKNTEVDIGPWQKGESVHSERAISYIKPLSNAIGPRSTKCLLKEQVHHMDIENYVTQVITTQTPDVPSGSSFCVKTRVCIMRAGQGKVRVLVTMVVEFTKSSWLKSTIEKASIDGQVNYYKSIDTSIRKYLQPPTQQQQPQKQHRRRRQRHIKHDPHHHDKHHSQHSTKVQQDTKNKKKMYYDMIMKSFSAGISTGTEWILQSRGPPSTQQLMVVCMILLVFINVYIATKMGHVTQKLVHHQQQQESTSFLSSSQHWDWSSLQQQQQQQQQQYYHDQERSSGNEENNNNESHPMMISGLNRQILEIERMIQQAGQSIDQVSKAVQQQQRMMMIHDEWSL